MKNYILTLFVIIFTNNLYSQIIFELCPGENTNSTIVDFEMHNDTIYSTGFYSVQCGESMGHISKWVNNHWESVSFSLENPGHSLHSINNNLYIAKYIESIDSNWVYFYDGNTMETLGTGVYNSTADGNFTFTNIYDIIEYDNKLIVCGDFDMMGQNIVNGIMQWNGTDWESLGNGLTGNIENTASVIYPHKMIVFNSNLYVVGNFRYAGGIEVNGIAVWDGLNWSGLGAGFDNTVYGLTIYNDEIIVGGAFTESDGQTLNRIAKWDGTQWISIGFGFVPESTFDFSFVHSLIEIDGLLYIGGGLQQIQYDDLSEENCGGLIAYNGTTITINTFEGGVEGIDVEAVIKSENDVILVDGGVWGNSYVGQIDLTNNIGDISVNTETVVYPNPCFDFFYADNLPKEIIAIKLFNSQGNVVKVFENNCHTFYISELEDGLYYLMIQNSKTFTMQKILIK